MSPEAKYWLGYIFADGHIIYNEGQAYSVSLFSKDETIMLKFKDFIGEKGRLYKRPTGIVQVAYNSKPTVEWFMNTLNVPVRKALVLNPHVEIDWDVLHGYFDGDGSIRMTLHRGKWKRYEAKFTTGSQVWASRIIKFLEQEGIRTHLSQKGNAFDIVVSGKASLYYMYSRMYASGTSKLEYKYSQFVALFSDEH